MADGEMDESRGSTLRKAVKNIKQLLKKEDKATEKKKPVKKEKSVKPFTSTRGLVYLGHIPHGFFEVQIRDYFKQFGKVTRVRLVRSKKTGRSKGYAYVEFEEVEVAKIAAETMNNYLMCGRLLKADFISPEKQHAGFFSGRQFTKKNYPGLKNRGKETRLTNTNVDAAKHTISVKKTIDRLSAIEKKLQARGIHFKVQPVDVPESIKNPPKDTVVEKKMNKRKIALANPPKTKKFKNKTATSLDDKSRKIVKKPKSAVKISAHKIKLGVQEMVKSLDVKTLIKQQDAKTSTLPITNKVAKKSKGKTTDSEAVTIVAKKTKAPKIKTKMEDTERSKLLEVTKKSKALADGIATLTGKQTKASKTSTKVKTETDNVGKLKKVKSNSKESLIKNKVAKVKGSKKK